MTIIRGYLLPLLLFGLLASSAWCAGKEPGGKGKLKSGVWTNNCFRPESGTVNEICADYTINWKLWTLMGEPVGDYNVFWKLVSLTLMDPDRKLKKSFTPATLPSELKEGAGAIELYIDGFAMVNVNNRRFHHPIYHRFNTGTAVRAGAGSSFNVPGSPNWNKLFVYTGVTCESDQQNFWGSYLDAKDAKAEFTQGIELMNLQLCRSSGVSELTSLEVAIAKLCEKPGADKKYEFCPKLKHKETKVTESNPIEDAFSRLEKETGRGPKVSTGSINRKFTEVEAFHKEQEHLRAIKLKAEEEREARRSQYVAVCAKAFEEQEKCLAACGIVPEKTVCDWQLSRKPRTPGVMYASLVPIEVVQEHSTKIAGNIIWPASSACRRVPNPEYIKWESCTSNLEKTCTPSGTRLMSVDDCVDRREQAAKRK